MKKLFIIIFLGITMTETIWAQTITIGTQVVASGTSGIGPTNYYWESRRIQWVYTAAEIIAAGGSAGTISAMAYDVSQVAGGNLVNYVIKMAHTTATNASSHNTSTLTTVKNAHTFTPGSTGWRTISFDNNFVWNGTSNLLVDVCWGINSGYSSTGQVWLYNNVANQMIGVYSSSSNQCGSNTTTTSSGKPRIQLTITSTPCSGTPTPGNTISSANPVCSGTGFTLSLQNVTPGSGLTYQWETSSTGSAPWTPVSGATNNIYNTTQTTATWYHCNVTCSGNTGVSNAVQVTMNSFINCYCLPTYSSGGSTDNIAQVTLGTLSQATSGNTSPYYYDYTSTQNAIPDLTQGTNANLSLTFGSDATQYNGVWVDFNQNGTFETSEFYSSNTNAGANGTANVVIAVPGGAALGNTRMRIRGGDDSQPTSTQACGASSSSYGQAQDYLVNIISSTSPLITVNPGSLDLGPVFNGNTSAELTYSLTGTNLTPSSGDITITPPANFEVSLTSGSGFSASPITKSYTGGAVSTTIYVVFKPTASNTNYNDNITNEGGGALSKNVAVTGTSYAFTPPFTENFDGVTIPALPGGWKMENVNADAYTWQTNTIAPNSSPNCLYIRYNSSLAMNDWVITPPIYLQTGKTYRVSCMYRGDGTYAEKLEVKYGTSQTAAGMTSSAIFSNTNILNSAYVNGSGTIVPGSTGYFYFGWHGFSDVDMNIILVDDIVIEEVFNDDVGSIALVSPVKIPIGQQLPWFGKVKNFGLNSESFQVDTKLRENTILSSTQTNAITGLTASSTASLSGSFNLSSLGYSSVFDLSIETKLTGDQNTSNDLLTQYAKPCQKDTVYAWDDGVEEGSVGYNTGSGWLGQLYYLSNQDTLTSITVKWGTIPGALAGNSFEIFNVAGGIPTTKVADIMTGISLTATDAFTWKTYVAASPVILPAGTYWIGAHQSTALSGTYLIADDQTGLNSNSFVTGFAFYSADGTSWTDYTTRELYMFNLLRPNFASPPSQWTGASGSDWATSGNWSFGIPVTGTNVIIPAVQNLPVVNQGPGSPAACRNLTINSGASVTIAAGKALTVYGTLTNNAGGSGLTIKSDATNGTGSLIHSTSSVPATVERYIENDLKWHFLSSPVAGQDIWPQFAPAPTGSPLSFGASPWDWDFYYWNPNASTSSELYWVNLRKENGEYNDGTIDATGSNAGFISATPQFTTARGYLAAYDNWASTTHSFAGNLYAGDVTRAITNGVNGFNLIGNPYPSSVDWDLADGASSWSRSGALESTSGYDYWIWDDGGSGNYLYRNSGGTGTAGQYIAPEQGFFVKSDADGGTLTFRNGTRTHSAQEWVKSSNANNHYIRLKITTGQNNYFDEMFVDFNTGYSGLEGTAKLWSFYQESPEIYCAKNARYYSINRLREPAEDLMVPVSVKTGIQGNYAIMAVDIIDFSLSEKVFLDDLRTGQTQELKKNPVYTFTGSPGDDPNRFRLRFGGPYGVNDPVGEQGWMVYAFDQTLHITGRSGIMTGGVATLCNMLGQKIWTRPFSGSSAQIGLNVAPGVYVVTVVAGNETCSRKIFVH